MADSVVAAQALLVAANSVLTLIAGFFIVRFVSAVDRLTDKMQQMDVRLSVLEAQRGDDET